MGDGCFTFMVSGNGVERGLQRQNSAWLHSHLVDGIEPNGVDPVNIMAGINAAQRSGRKLRATPVDVAAKLVVVLGKTVHTACDGQSVCVCELCKCGLKPHAR